MADLARSTPGTAAPPDDPVAAAILGPHRSLGLGGEGPAVRYRPEISPFGSVGVPPGEETWRALADLPGDICAVFAAATPSATPGWRVTHELELLQMVGPTAPGGVGSGDGDPGVEPLGPADVPAMLDLTARTQPGPFLAQTIRFGGYVGIRRDGVLAAMAGRRLHPEGWIEVSAVCADPAHRGQGLARRVTSAVMAGIDAEGARPFLHVVETNPARRLYEALGFTVARQPRIVVLERA